MINNQLSRYGAVSRNLPEVAPSAKVFFVGDSDDTTYGIQNLAADFPPDRDGVTRVYSTIQAAINATSANRGDVVLVAPNHSEDFTRADCWDKAGVQIIGMGQGDRRPALVYNAKTASVAVKADGMRVSNLMFLTSSDSTALGVSIDTGIFGVRFDNNVFTSDAGTDDFRQMLRVGSKESIIENNQFLARDTAGAGSGIVLVGGDPDFLTIRNNYFYGQFDTVGDTTNGAGTIVADSLTLTDASLDGLFIHHNYFCNTDTAAAMYLRLGIGGLAVRGLITENRFASYDSTAATDTTKVTGGGARFSNNLVATADSSTEKRVGDTQTVLS